MVTFMVTTTDTVMVMVTAMATVTTIIIAKVFRKKNEKSVRRPTKSTKRLIRKSTSNINIVTKQRGETTGRQLEPNGKKKELFARTLVKKWSLWSVKRDDWCWRQVTL